MDISRRRLLQGAAALGTSFVGNPLAAYANAPTLSASERATVTQAATDFMRTHNVPGLSFAISANGVPIYAQAIGYANPQSGERLTPQHRFRIASLSKPITSAAVLQLIEKGAISPSSHVFGPGAILANDYRIAPGRDAVRRITVEHLLTHTGGGWGNDADDPMFEYPHLNQRDLINWTLSNRPLAAEPGTQFAYSNFGYCVLGRVIEKITGQPYAPYVQRNVLAPCGVFDMQIAGNTIASRAPVEVTYFGQNGGKPYGMNVARMDSHGGWIATPRDLIAFMAQIDGLNGRPSLLRRDTFAYMTAGTSANRGYGKGIAVSTAHNMGHTGSLPGTETVLTRTNTSYCWAALTNTRVKGENLDAFMWRLVRGVPALRV